jgi:hypothetical protein
VDIWSRHPWALGRSAGDHIGAWPAIEAVELEFSATTAAGALIRSGMDWRTVHAVHVGRPIVDWPDGRPPVTAIADAYARHGVATVPVIT